MWGDGACQHPVAMNSNAHLRQEAVHKDRVATPAASRGGGASDDAAGGAAVCEAPARSQPTAKAVDTAKWCDKTRPTKQAPLAGESGNPATKGPQPTNKS